MAQLYYALRLRFNPDEADNKQLMTHLDKVCELLNSNSDRYRKCIIELANLAKVARVFIKRGWVRVENGEDGYRTVVHAVRWVALTLAVVLFVLLCK
jgi:hypothetical protein